MGIADQCVNHKDHETRISNLEDDMKEVKKCQKSPAVIVALIGLAGTCMSTLGAFCGVVLVAYLKAKGWM